MDWWRVEARINLIRIYFAYRNGSYLRLLRWLPPPSAAGTVPIAVNVTKLLVLPALSISSLCYRPMWRSQVSQTFLGTKVKCHLPTSSTQSTVPGGEKHFDVHIQAYRELMGDAGVTADSGYVTYMEITPSKWKLHLQSSPETRVRWYYQLAPRISVAAPLKYPVQTAVKERKFTLGLTFK
jgi:hypothetical protein